MSNTPVSPASEAIRQELQPVSRWKTMTTKIMAAPGIAFGAVFSVAGVAALVVGKGPSDFKSGEIRLLGALAAAVGATITVASKAMYDTASGATRARNFTNLHQQLTAMDAARGRA